MEPELRRPWRRAAAAMWAGFLVAAALELAVFAFVDPAALHGLSGVPVQASPTAIYSAAFLVFWVVAAAGAALSLLLDGDTEQISQAQPDRRGPTL